MERFGDLQRAIPLLERGLKFGHMNPNAGSTGEGVGRDLSLEKRFWRKGGRIIPHRLVGQVTCGFFHNHVELGVIEELHAMLKGCALLPRPCCRTSGACGR